MNRPFSIVIFLALMSIGIAISASAADLDTCNQQYHGGKYEAAIDCYNKIGKNSQSAALLFNIGNSYAQLNKPGFAILYYLRALCLSPGDADAAGNLHLLQKEHGLFPPEATLAHRFFNSLTISQWSLVCLLALIFYLAFSILQLGKKFRPVSELAVTLASVIVFTLGGYGAAFHYLEWQRSVVVSDSQLLISPFDEATAIGSIQQGRLVRTGKHYNEFVHVTDETGKTGWLPNDNLRSILPP